ncbi:MAG: histidine kinase [Synechococcales cyanobacterium K44_A2020_017]|jgi:hypothetical protein|uniref:histidine kinase n=1 Tax=Leptolyngbya sp. CCY15150 TaxID=2767772 RepID=UPI0019526A54|nr:histidine kinase [Leptolyngbya sp. CCY15150]MBF2087651.1 histidine kinase [Synechococcales cyanobacterium K32_A2020_035]MBF2096272.1 histidine kinase [Synechococcales cyanobacterium K44_A2020_017]
MTETSCHIIVEGNPAVIYASRNGKPAKVVRTLGSFLEKFWQERDTSGEHTDTPECLVAQIIVRFGFEICEDDYSNLRVGLKYSPNVDYLYFIGSDRTLKLYSPTDAYRATPSLGVAACQELAIEPSLS